ncbi:60S ribosomal protein L18a-like [Tropilaelaps mercedesae]|uniref:60S ribosomal protein L18a n=1 Tax=Tropilaelaps mercedesae TaxID=418985 RepID=A0A1V9XTD6_9ACAR|nr:60S ribosomal protein L18a-like [Tropilaelaps mercedesae]
MKASGLLRHYELVGRAHPTEREPHPKLYKMYIFAPDYVTAKSRFWYFIRKLKKVKKTTGEVISIKRIPERNPGKVKNYGIWLRYNSRSGIHNMYREYRDVSTEGAVTQCYRDMGARHRAQASSIQIIRVESVQASKTRRAHIKQFHDQKIKFPHPFPIKRNFHAQRFAANRPIVRFQ